MHDIVFQVFAQHNSVAFISVITLPTLWW